jgi:hypothetical protein
MSERERPVPGWIKSYRAGNMTLEELAERINGHTFEEKPYKDWSLERKMLEEVGSDIEPGTYDDVNFGDLTEDEKMVISKRVWRDVNR